MVAVGEKPDFQSPVPQVPCPRCKQPMRLVSIEPMADSGDNRVLFQCHCGFECRFPEQNFGDAASSQV